MGAHGSGEGGDRPRCGRKDPRRSFGEAPSWSGWSGKLLGWGLGVGTKWQNPGCLGGIGERLLQEAGWVWCRGKEGCKGG